MREITFFVVVFVCYQVHFHAISTYVDLIISGFFSYWCAFVVFSYCSIVHLKLLISTVFNLCTFVPPGVCFSHSELSVFSFDVLWAIFFRIQAMWRPACFAVEELSSLKKHGIASDSFDSFQSLAFMHLQLPSPPLNSISVTVESSPTQHENS